MDGSSADPAAAIAVFPFPVPFAHASTRRCAVPIGMGNGHQFGSDLSIFQRTMRWTSRSRVRARKCGVTEPAGQRERRETQHASGNYMTKRLLVSSILLGLAAALPAPAVLAQSADTSQSVPDTDKDKKKTA